MILFLPGLEHQRLMVTTAQINVTSTWLTIGT